MRYYGSGLALTSSLTWFQVTPYQPQKIIGKANRLKLQQECFSWQGHLRTKHLHQMWIWSLDCRSYQQGGQVKISTDVLPRPQN